MKNILILLLIYLTNATCATGAGPEYCSKTQGLNVATDTLWEQTEIHVCWAESAMLDEHAAWRDIAHDIVDDTWNKELSPPEVPMDEWVQFVGFEECVSGDGHDVVMKVGPGSDRVNGLGTDATYVNFNWSNPDKPIWDIERTAIHEFGHLLGLAHEHNRHDTGDRCSYDPQGSDGDAYYGKWDHDSVMNYCNSRYADSVLSDNDKYWIKRVYYPDYFEFACEVYIVYDDNEQDLQALTN
jgi:hypothetical protein